MLNFKLNESIKFILIDFFDTVMFREIHSCHMHKIWADNLKKKYPVLEKVNLLNLRIETAKKLEKWECEIKYNELIDNIIQSLENMGYKVDSTEFYEKSLDIEIVNEQLVQYPNMEIINFLCSYKKQGKKLFLVSDFYLPTIAYERFLSLYGLKDLFDEIICSSEYGQSKKTGELYKTIIAQFGIDPEKTVMIGDDKISDYENPLNFGIEAYRYFPLTHKIKVNYRRFLRKSSYNSIDILYQHMYNFTNFAEYGFNVFYTMKKLLKILSKRDVSQVGFLSRGGYFLYKSFNLIKQKCSDNKIKSIYVMNSRYVNDASRKDCDKANLMKKYFEALGFCSPMYLVDEGWYCSAQITFSELYNWTTYGYYLGVMEQRDAPLNCYREGLLFNSMGKDKYSRLYGLFRTNCTFYEQILTAPHGSLIGYVDKGDSVGFLQKEITSEKQLYMNYTSNLQQQMLEVVSILSTMDIEIPLYWLAKRNLKTLLIANKNRLRMLREYNKSYYNNFYNNTKKDISKYSIRLTGLIARPEDYMRFICKVKEVYSGNYLCRILYKPLGIMLYVYCYCFLFVRYRND